VSQAPHAHIEQLISSAPSLNPWITSASHGDMVHWCGSDVVCLNIAGSYLRNVAFESAVRGLLADLGRVGVDAVSVNDRVDVS